MRVAGRVLPARHRGSVDVFIEALKKSSPGDVLVIDNQGRIDESCIGDLTVLEVRAWGLSGVVVRGLSRDTSELIEIGFPVFSYGSLSPGPRRLDERGPLDLISAEWSNFTVDNTDSVFADDDGVIFVPSTNLHDILKVARSIYRTERDQAEKIKVGKKLWEQFDFDGYLKLRETDPSYSLRKHSRTRGGAVEE